MWITKTGPRLAIFLFKAICGHSLCWTSAHRLHGVAIATPDRPRAGTPAPSDSATRHRRAHKLHAPGARAAAPHARAYAYTPVHIHHRARESLPARTTPVLALTQRACHTFHSAACAGDVFHSALNMKFTVLLFFDSIQTFRRRSFGKTDRTGGLCGLFTKS